MEKRRSLAEIQEIPGSNLILLSGPPGAGKSTFCQQVVLNGLAVDKPVIFVTTEHGPTEVIDLLKTKGMGESPPGHSGSLTPSVKPWEQRPRSVPIP